MSARRSVLSFSVLRRGLAPLAALTLLSACLPASVVRPPGDGSVMRAPASIDATGTRDVTYEMQEFIKDWTDGKTIVFPQNARYRIEGTLLVIGRSNMTIEGNGATFFATTTGDYDRSQLLFRLGRNILVRNLNVKGANPNAGMADEAYVGALEAQHGFELEGVRDFVLDHVRVTDTYGDFVYIVRDLKTMTWSENVTIRDSHFERNGRQGITITSGRNVFIEHNYIGNTRRATIDLEPNGHGEGAQNIWVRGNRVGPGRLNFVSSGPAPGVTRDIYVVNNQLEGRILNVFVKPPEGVRRSNIVVVNNTADKLVYGSEPLRFVDVDGLVIVGNTQPVRDEPILLIGTTQETIADNNFELDPALWGH